MITRRVALVASDGAVAPASAPAAALARVADSPVLGEAMSGTQTPGMAALVMAGRQGPVLGGDATALGGLRALAATVSRPAETPAQ